MTEFDLPARLNKTIKKDLKDNRFEIVDIKSKDAVHTAPTLKEIDRIANNMGDGIRIECDSTCPVNQLSNAGSHREHGR